MSKYIKPWRPLLFCSAQSSTFTARMPPGHMSTAQPSELACLPQEPQSHNEAQDLLLLQDYVCKLTHTQNTGRHPCLIAAFFSSSLADVALRLGPYMSISSEKKFVQRTQLVQMSRQIKPKRQQNHQNTTTRKSPSQTCVSSENAANKNKNQTKHKQTGPEPKNNTHKINLPRDTVV